MSREITSFFSPSGGVPPQRGHSSRDAPASASNGMVLRRAHTARVSRRNKELFPRADEAAFDGAAPSVQESILDAAQKVINSKRMSQRQADLRIRKEKEREEQVKKTMEEMTTAQLRARQPPEEGSKPSPTRRTKRRLAQSPYSVSKGPITNADN